MKWTGLRAKPPKWSTRGSRSHYAVCTQLFIQCQRNDGIGSGAFKPRRSGLSKMALRKERQAAKSFDPLLSIRPIECNFCGGAMRTPLQPVGAAAASGEGDVVREAAAGARDADGAGALLDRAQRPAHPRRSTCRTAFPRSAGLGRPESECGAGVDPS